MLTKPWIENMESYQYVHLQLGNLQNFLWQYFCIHLTHTQIEQIIEAYSTYTCIQYVHRHTVRTQAYSTYTGIQYVHMHTVRTQAYSTYTGIQYVHMHKFNFLEQKHVGTRYSSTYFCRVLEWICTYSVIQEEMLIVWNVVLSVMVKKKDSINACLKSC